MSALKQAQRFVLQPPGAQLHLIAVDRPVWGSATDGLGESDFTFVQHICWNIVC